MKKIIAFLLVSGSCSGQLSMQSMQPFFNSAVNTPCITSRDDFSGYTPGSSVAGLNGGICWSGSYVTKGF